MPYMKVFVYILSIYILFLTAVPCVDKPDNCDVHKTEISGKTTNGHNEDIDHCSPFCTCNCCASPKIQQEVLISFNSYQFLIKCCMEYTITKVSAHTASVWQPPRLN